MKFSHYRFIKRDKQGFGDAVELCKCVRVFFFLSRPGWVSYLMFLLRFADDTGQRPEQGAALKTAIVKDESSAHSQVAKVGDDTARAKIKMQLHLT